ncbi:uncharacterized protein [Dendrobates tinctorius]|uniref:uncharacterized protein n=1 Tax=Dendrobates tinctorius TaxID=92724 RepID=UPI003CC9A1D5
MTEKFVEYLSWSEVLVRIDNNPLTHQENAKLGALEQRLVARMAKYQYKIAYRREAENTHADTLSRVTHEKPGPSRDKKLEAEEVPGFRSPSRTLSGNSTTASPIHHLWVPKALLHKVAVEAHEKGAHFSQEKTYQWLQKLVYHPLLKMKVPQRDEDVYLDNEQLISLVQERAPLWDSRDRLYKDNVVTRRLWNEVAAALMDGWDSATASSKKAFSEYFPALYCAAVTVVLDGTVGFRARYILAGNPTVSSGSTVTALSIVLLYCAAVTVVLDGTVGFRARYILAGNPTVSSGSTVTALSIVLLYCAAVTVVLDSTVGFRARYILAGNPTVSSGSTVTALSIVLLYCAAVTVVLDGTVGFRARYILAGNPTVSSGSTVTALSIVLLYCAAVTVVLDGTVFFFPTVDKVRTRWRSIKDRFNSDVRAEGQVRSGSASRTRTRYRHYHVLQFLRPVLATRSTWSSTLQPGPGAVLPRTSSDPSQPSDSYEAPCRSATHTAGDQEAGPSGVPLSQVSATGYAGTTRQRQRALDRNVLPEFMHLSEAFNSSLKSLSDRVESGFALMERGFNHFEHRFNSVEQRLDRLEADLNRPAHHFFLVRLKRAWRNTLVLSNS